MLGVKRKSSSAADDERPSKLAKRSTSEKPTSLGKIPSVGTSRKTREIALSGSSTSDGSSDLGSPTPPALRRASTLTVEEKEAAKAAETLSRKTSSKELSSASKPSLTKKASSVVIEDGTVTTVVPLKSGSSIGETALVSKESLKKAESITKSLSKTASMRSTGSSKRAESLTKSLSKSASVRSTTSAKEANKETVADEEKDEAMDTSVPLPPGGLLEVVISFDTTGSMYGVLEEVRAKVKDLIQRLQADIPGIRIAIIAHGDYCDAATYIVKWIDFGATLPELCDFVSNVQRTGGGDGPECYELVLKRAREELKWTPGSQRVLVIIGDNEPHPVGYKYGGQTYYIDWKEECYFLREMGVKVYGVKANAWGGVHGFFKEAPNMTFGRAVELKNFTSIFDFLMMICYREGNPDMIPAYESEVRARHKGGMAKDMEELVKTFGADSGSSPSASTSLFGVPTSYTPFPFTLPSKKAVKATKLSPLKAIKKAAKPTKAAKTKKPSKPAKATKKLAKKPKAAAAKKQTKKTIIKTSVKKIKGKAKKRVPKKKTVIKKKLLREKLIDAKLSTGPLNKLNWSDWYLGVCHLIPKGISYKKFQKSSVFGAYHRRNLFDNDTKTPAIYEIGVKKFGKWTIKKHVMYYRVCRGYSSNKSLILYLLRNKKIRKEVERLIGNSPKFEIHIRRGVLKSKSKSKVSLTEAAAYLHANFDYAWWRHGKKGHRKVVKDGTLLSDPAL